MNFSRRTVVAKGTCIRSAHRAVLDTAIVQVSS